MNTEQNGGTSKPPSNLTEQQVKAALLLAYYSHRKVAMILGIGTTTICRWKRIPAFVQAHQEACEMVRKWSLSRGLKLAEEAVAALRRNLRCGEPRDEIAAAKAILDVGKEYLDEADQKQIIQSLKRLEERSNGPAQVVT